MPRGDWSGAQVTRARDYIRARLPLRCIAPDCGQVVDGAEAWVVAHVEPRWKRPDLIDEPGNWSVMHRVCSDRTGRAEQLAQKRAQRSDGGNPVGRRRGLSPRSARTSTNGADPTSSGDPTPQS